MENSKAQIVIITALKSELSRDAIPHGVTLVYSGVGKINATLATVKAIQHYQPAMIINFGTVGKVNSALRGLIEINKVIQRDMIAEPLSPRGQTPLCKRPHVYTSSTGQYACGTGDSFVTARDPWLEEQRVDVVDMELFAIAAVANEYQLPWHAFKYITDDANDSSAQDWHENVSFGEALFLKKLNHFLTSYPL